MKTTLNKIRSHSPCEDGWKKLLKHLGKTAPDDEPLSLLTVLESNGLDDTLWCFRAVEGFDRELRLFAVFCARRVQHLMQDPRSIAALDVAERFANGQATSEELDAARAASSAAVREAPRVTSSAALATWYSARAAAWAADRTSASASSASAEAAAVAADRTSASASASAEAAAYNKERKAQAAELCKILSHTNTNTITITGTTP